MADTDIRLKALDALVIMITALKNVRLYPPTSATIINAVERLHLIFLGIFEQESPVIFAESEKSILICGKLLEQKDQERSQVVTLLNILLGFGIRSISFGKNLEKEELNAFIDILSKKPEFIKNEGGLSQVMAGKNIRHICLDEKVYVTLDKDRKIISSLDITDDQITQSLMSSLPELAADSQKLQETFKDKDPEWILQTFRAGLLHLESQKGTLSNVQISEKLQEMLVLLDKVTASLDQKDRENISQQIGETIATGDIARQLTTQTMEQLFGGVLLQFLIGKLEDIKYAETQRPGGGTADGQGGAGADGTGHQPGTRSICISGEEGKQNSADDQGKTDIKPNLIQVSKNLILSLKKNENTLLDESLMSILPRIIEQLIAQKEHDTMEKVISNLVDNLFSDNAEVRAHAAKALTDIIDSLPPERKTEMIESLSERLIEWIKIETSATPAYRTVCNYLLNIMQNFIKTFRFAETIPMLDIFSNMNVGILKKDNTMCKISLEIIRNLAAEEYFAILFKELNTNEKNKRDEADRILVGFGDVILNRLLDILRESGDSNERINALHIIIGMGQKALPAIIDQINKNAVWYYLRNLAYILGRIGNETHAHLLQPLLLHKDSRVRLEALKSISQIGRNQRGALLLSVLPKADDQFKLSIIETLGNAKCVDAVPNLLELLKKRSLKVLPLQIDMQEKICTALGLIGSSEAISTLSEIAESKSFLRLRVYPEQVKNAAQKALASIKRKQKKSGNAES